MNKTFRTCDNKGFQITFPNGITLSTQFGWGNYCEHNYDPMPNFKKPRPDAFSDTAEIAIIGPDDEWLTRDFKDGGDDVLGWVKIDDWLKAFDWCRNWKRGQKKAVEG